VRRRLSGLETTFYVCSPNSQASRCRSRSQASTDRGSNYDTEALSDIQHVGIFRFDFIWRSHIRNGWRRHTVFPRVEANCH
jgi:hypothetical protein